MTREPRESGLFWPAALRLALAGAVFVLVYGGCNRLTALRDHIPTLMFPWEVHIPFIREFVVPYWSLDLFFCGAFFLCSSRMELNLLTKRLIAVTIASGVCFLLFPLQMGVPRPDPAGWTAPLFHALYANDLPYNLAPSLHISLRSLIWICYGAHLAGWPRRIVKVWFMLIGASTLLVWQHHVLDVASGFLMGWLVALWIPDPRQPCLIQPSGKLAIRYGAGVVFCGALCLASVLFVWPAVACGIFALAYATGNPRVLGKENGTLSPAAEWCLLPVLLTAFLIQRKWLKRRPAWQEIGQGVLFGRRLRGSEAEALAVGGDLAVLDLTAESNAPAAFRERAVYQNLAVLDLVPLTPEHIRVALQFIEAQRNAGRRVYIHCQLGLQRSALIAAHWIVDQGAAADFHEAREKIRAIRPDVVM